MEQAKAFKSFKKEEFQPLWQTLLAIAPGLHPDEIGEENSGWSENKIIKNIGEEASRRFQENEFDDNEFYDASAQRSGFSHREEYPDYTLDDEFYSSLDDKSFSLIWETLNELSDEINKESWENNPVLMSIRSEAKNRELI